jgi:hypothetical protein
MTQQQDGRTMLSKPRSSPPKPLRPPSRLVKRPLPVRPLARPAPPPVVAANPTQDDSAEWKQLLIRVTPELWDRIEGHRAWLYKQGVSQSLPNRSVVIRDLLDAALDQREGADARSGRLSTKR